MSVARTVGRAPARGASRVCGHVGSGAARIPASCRRARPPAARRRRLSLGAGLGAASTLLRAAALHGSGSREPPVRAPAGGAAILHKAPRHPADHAGGRLPGRGPRPGALPRGGVDRRPRRLAARRSSPSRRRRCPSSGRSPPATRFGLVTAWAAGARPVRLLEPLRDRPRSPARSRCSRCAVAGLFRRPFELRAWVARDGPRSASARSASPASPPSSPAWCWRSRPPTRCPGSASSTTSAPWSRSRWCASWRRCWWRSSSAAGSAPA